MRAIATIALSALLGGCWAGPAFYNQSDSKPALEAGRYKVVDIVDPFGGDFDPDFGKRVRVSYAKDGQASINDASEQGDETSEVVFVPLEGAPKIFIVQAALFPDLTSPNGRNVQSRAIYGLINVTADGYELALPPCDGTQRLRAGSNVTVGGLAYFRKSACIFSNRADFEDAMHNFAKDPIRWARYKRVKG